MTHVFQELRGRSPKRFVVVAVGVALMAMVYLSQTTAASQKRELANTSPEPSVPGPRSLVNDQRTKDNGQLTEDQTAFTYQGQLKDGNGPVNGTYDFQFVLYSAQSGEEKEKLSANELRDVVLTNGMFSLRLDFGGAAVEAKESWLEIGVRQSGGAAPYTVLFPRQKLTPTPYAIFAQHGQWSLIGVPVGFASSKEGASQLRGEVSDPGMTGAKKVGEETAKGSDSVKHPMTDAESKTAAAPAGVEWTRDGQGNLFPTNLGDRVGIGTNTPASKLDINGQDGMRIFGYQPFLTLTDTNQGNHPVRIQTANGVIGFQTEGDIANRLPASVEIENPSDARTSKLLVRAQNGLETVGYQPFLTLTDSNAGFARRRIQSANGVLGFQTEGDIRNGLPASVEILNPPDARTAKLLVRAQNGLETVGFQPFLTLSDSNAGFAHIRIQDVGGNIGFQTHSNTTGAGGSAMFIKDGTNNIGIGTTNPQAKLDVVGMTRTGVLQITGGSDLAEPFEIAAAESILPGMLVAIDPKQPGRLRIVDKAYDRTVAGIISGANGINAGLTMKQEGTPVDGAYPVALTGRVYCWADASLGSIGPGDFLTTSNTPGHAMRATNLKKAQGAIIGKAMTKLERGKGLVLVLVMPQ